MSDANNGTAKPARAELSKAMQEEAEDRRKKCRIKIDEALAEFDCLIFAEPFIEEGVIKARAGVFPR